LLLAVAEKNDKAGGQKKTRGHPTRVSMTKAQYKNGIQDI